MVVNTALVVATGALQMLAQFALGRIFGSLPALGPGALAAPRRMIRSTATVVVLMSNHLLQVTLWAWRYYELGELGDFNNCFYFSLASFTTVGASELVLSPAHRMTGALEAATGMLMFGWSTALLVEILNRIDRGRASG